MKNLLYIAMFLILHQYTDVHAEEFGRKREHTFSWVLSEPEKSFRVGVWELDGTKNSDTEDGLRKLKNVSISPNDVIHIHMPVNGPKDSPMFFPAEGCIMPVLLHYWRNKGAKFRLYREATNLNAVIISWRSEGPYNSTKNAIYQLDGEDIGDYEAARKKLSALEVNKDSAVIIFHRDKSGPQWLPMKPHPFPAPLGKWRGSGAEYVEIPDFEWPGESIKNAFQGVAFPGEDASKNPVAPQDQKSDDNKSLPSSQKN